MSFSSPVLSHSLRPSLSLSLSLWMGIPRIFNSMGIQRAAFSAVPAQSVKSSPPSSSSASSPSSPPSPPSRIPFPPFASTPPPLPVLPKPTPQNPLTPLTPIPEKGISKRKKLFLNALNEVRQGITPKAFSPQWDKKKKRFVAAKISGRRKLFLRKILKRETGGFDVLKTENKRNHMEIKPKGHSFERRQEEYWQRIEAAMAAMPSKMAEYYKRQSQKKIPEDQLHLALGPLVKIEKAQAAEKAKAEAKKASREARDAQKLQKK